MAVTLPYSNPVTQDRFANPASCARYYARLLRRVRMPLGAQYGTYLKDLAGQLHLSTAGSKRVLRSRIEAVLVEALLAAVEA